MTKIIILTLLSLSALSGQKTICGTSDDRVPSFDDKVGRLSSITPEGYYSGFCTVTMISKSCGITAGHCKKALQFAEFAVPNSIKNSQGSGSPRSSKKTDIYLVDQSTIITSYTDEKTTPQDDWAVFNFRKNRFTQKFPGESSGFYNVNTGRLGYMQRVSITGYGVDNNDATRNFTQQVHDGLTLGIRDGIIFHNVDTMGGNSGAAILNSRDEVVGIHTNGGCQKYKTNVGVSVFGNSKLQAAIKKCLSK